MFPGGWKAQPLQKSLVLKGEGLRYQVCAATSSLLAEEKEIISRKPECINYSVCTNSCPWLLCELPSRQQLWVRHL